MQPDKEIGKLLSGYQQACVLMTANNLGVFDAVSEGPVTHQSVAKTLAFSEKGTVRLLNALVSMGIVEVSPDGYRLGSDWKSYLTKMEAQHATMDRPVQ